LLTEGARSGKSMNEILNTFPAQERIKAFKIINANPELQRLITPSAVSITTPPVNALAPEQQNQNALAR